MTIDRYPTGFRVTVYAGSSFGASPAFSREAERFITDMVSSGAEIVYGGGKVGLMGVVAKAALNAGGKVTGVIPRALTSAEISHTSLSTLHIVDSMATRKKLMEDLGNCFVALPGGIGTIEETIEVLSNLILGNHKKPIFLLNVNHYWDRLLDLVAHVVEAGFANALEGKLLMRINSNAELLVGLKQWSPPLPRWGES
ncbi:TIGR00730 family Rossman fold protein [Burkholderia sp. Ac-20344]|uniref:LOG family protein n=1 Tax=Burkholderia sp. Ac-20344 TaxID=2703890 RepID=UPI00197B34D3|nr:TIGR00730 family Rossman fold protein [Burkholderia sp. Ac-20344]MBN3831030.1 TIGR00730 family Rossman fold protein [Burkholderia sp. Ac-20344]